MDRALDAFSGPWSVHPPTNLEKRPNARSRIRRAIASEERRSTLPALFPTYPAFGATPDPTFCLHGWGHPDDLRIGRSNREVPVVSHRPGWAVPWIGFGVRLG